jgi:hypothetical protein
MGCEYSFDFAAEDLEDYSDAELCYWYDTYLVEKQRLDAKRAQLSGTRWDPPNFWQSNFVLHVYTYNSLSQNNNDVSAYHPSNRITVRVSPKLCRTMHHYHYEI